MFESLTLSVVGYLLTFKNRFATAIVLGIGFGVTIKDDNDPYIQMATDASYALGHCGAPAGTLTDFFPIGASNINIKMAPQCSFMCSETLP